jgi:hypothetical protein
MRAWPRLKTNINNASNTRISSRMLEQLALRTLKTVHSTSEQEWPSFCVDTRDDDDWSWWKPYKHPYLENYLFISHIQFRSHDDHFPIPLWETWFCQSLGVPSTGAPQSDGVLNKTVRMKIRHYRQIYVDRPDPIVFLSIVVSTSGRVYEDFARLHFLHSHREFYPEKYLRNRTSFVSCEFHVWLISKDV